MKANTLHTIIFCFLCILSTQNCFCSISQEPHKNRTFNSDFKEKYADTKFNYEGTAVVNHTPSGSGDYDDYSNRTQNPREANNNDALSINLGPFSWVFYIAIFAAVVYLVYILLNDGGSGLFSSRGHKKLDNPDEITSENIENTDINTLIGTAENNNDYRLAIRYYYLLVLKTLSLKKHIVFEDDKTNADYLIETSGRPYEKDFTQASYLYNYIWYGEFPLTTEQYSKAKSNFSAFLIELNQ